MVMRHRGASVTVAHPTEPGAALPGRAGAARVSSPFVRSRLSRSVPSSLPALALTAIVGLAGCASDGRELRPARPDQVGSVSTLAAPTTTVGAVVDGGLEIGAVTTLPGEVLVSSDVDDVGELGFAVLTGPVGEGSTLPIAQTCDGANLSPALSWTAAPDGTAEIAVTLTDVDVPGYVHWVMAGLDPTTTSLAEGEVPLEAVVGLNSSRTLGYTGPCPPEGGAAHTYVFTVHFLLQQTELITGAAGEDLLLAVEDATFDSASFSASYARS